MTKSTPAFSRQRQQLSRLIKEISRLAQYAAHDAPLIRATPSYVYRTCSTPNCKCVKKPPQKHGPYPVLQLNVANKRKQVSLKKDDIKTFEKAQHYQKNLKNYLQLKSLCRELEQCVSHLIDARVEDWSP